MNKKPGFLLTAAWLMVLAAMLFSMVSLLTGGIKLVGREDYAIIERYKRLDDVYNILVDGYYQDLNEDELIHGAITGMTAAVEDEYTQYFTSEEMQENDMELNGKYSGVGLLLQKNALGEVEVIRVYDDSPAAQAGLQPGDIIIRINDLNMAGNNPGGFDAAVNEIRGEDGTSLTVEVLRDGETAEYVLERREVVISNISHCMLDNNIGYIQIIQFGGNAVEGFIEAREQLKDADALIIDVRNNPGGLLDDVLAIADELLEDQLVVYMETRDGTREDYYSERGAWDIPVAVLINESSASASEILAAAVQDHKRGAVIGTQSYGKGIVQMLTTFEEDGAGLQYTFAKYFTPSGNDIHKIGVTPDIIIENEANFIHGAAVDVQNDAQLARAVKYLLEETE